MSTTESLRWMERLGKAVAVWGGLVGLMIWCAVYVVRGGFGLVELVSLIGIPILLGLMVRVIGWVVEGSARG